jgi:tRNA(adenine34) deaminase
MEDKFMREALEEAKKAFDKGDVPVGAVIVRGNEIIARAYNRREETKDVTDHAEIIAIRAACKHLNDWRLNGCIMYVTLEPCSMCLGAIKQSRIDKVIYGTSNANEINGKPAEMCGGILEQECSDILKTFFQIRRNE